MQMLTFILTVLLGIQSSHVSIPDPSVSSDIETKTLTPSQQRAVVTEALQEYDHGIALMRSDATAAREHFRASAQRFEWLASTGVQNGQLLYNLGNAKLLMGDVGRAILNYRRAEHLIPSDPRLAANLQHARSQVRTQIAASGERAITRTLLHWHERTSFSARAFIFCAGFAVFWLALAVRVFRAVPGTISVCVFAGLVALISGGSIAFECFGWDRSVAGVLIADDVTIRKGNGLGFEPRFEQPLHAGVEFDLLERRGDWMWIRLVNDADGWIESRFAELVP